MPTTFRVSAWSDNQRLGNLPDAARSALLELRANPDRAAEATVIEAKLDKGKGPLATVLVRRGTLKRGDMLVCGQELGRVRAMFDENGQAYTSNGAFQWQKGKWVFVEDLPSDAKAYSLFLSTLK